MPVGVGGWQIGTHASALDYSLSEAFGTLGVEGSSTEVGLDANYPLIRSKNKNLSFAMSYDDTNFKNSDLFGDSEYSVSGFDARLTGQHFDTIGGINQATLIFANGTVDDKTGKLSQALGERFSKVRFALNRQQQLSDRFSLFGSFSGQLADSNLTSSEKFTLGGTSGVRAYRSSEGSGDEGQLLNAEVRMRLPYSIGLAAFYDIGTVTVEKNPAANVTTAKRYTLSGAGLSARWQSKWGMGLKATWATPIGTNKGATASLGDSADEDEDLIWLQASMNF
jgi:hemolysin activation/secretion protein